CSPFFFFFFFQAEDGIRDRNVTGVQTCALPISSSSVTSSWTTSSVSSVSSFSTFSSSFVTFKSALISSWDNMLSSVIVHSPLYFIQHLYGKFFMFFTDLYIHFWFVING